MTSNPGWSQCPAVEHSRQISYDATSPDDRD
jgi:hypothetical protein